MSDPYLSSREMQEVENVDPNKPIEPEYNVEELAFMIANERARDLHQRTSLYLKELKQRLANVRALTEYMALLNSVTDANGQVDLTKDPDFRQKLEALIPRLQEAAMTFPQDDPTATPQIPEGQLCFDIPRDKNGQFKTLFTKEERERLFEVLQNTTKNLTFDNHMQTQEITRLTSEKTEFFQYFRVLQKPIHEAKIMCLRNMANK